MRLPEYCATHTPKEFMEMMQIGETVCGCNRPDCSTCHDAQCKCDRCDKLGPDFPFDNTKGVTAAQINSTEFPRAVENGWDVLDEDHPPTCRCEVCRFWS